MTTEETPEVQPTLEEPDTPLAPAMLEESPPAMPPPAQPVAEEEISDGSLICTVCLGTVGRGEKYVRTLTRGVNHLEPCSHRA